MAWNEHFCERAVLATVMTPPRLQTMVAFVRYARSGMKLRGSRSKRSCATEDDET
jgi:hypothetical protein